MLGGEAPVTGLVVGGCDAAENEFPSQLSIQMRSPGEPPTYRHMCGASVLSRHWAITAAHCVAPHTQDLTPLSVVSGTTQLSHRGRRHQLQEAVVHPDYDKKSKRNDIALLKVAKPFLLDGVKVAAARLPAQGQEVPDDAEAVIVGWGLLKETDTEPSERLQKAQLRVVNLEACRRAYRGVGDYVHSTNLCAGVSGGGTGACKGDSGGPLFVDGVLVGLTSFSVGCGEPGFPAVFTRVASYVDWIRRHTE